MDISSGVCYDSRAAWQNLTGLRSSYDFLPLMVIGLALLLGYWLVVVRFLLAFVVCVGISFWRRILFC